MYTWFLSIRYLLRRRFSALGTLLAVVFGVATLFTVLSVMEGYRVKLRELVRGLESHLTITGAGAPLAHIDQLEEVVRSAPSVVATAPFVESLTMYRSLSRFSVFELRGVDPVAEAHVTDLAKQLLRPAELDQVLGAPGESREAMEARLRQVMDEKRRPLSDEEVEEAFSRARRKAVLSQANPSAPVPEPLPGALIVGVNLLLDRDVYLGGRVAIITLEPKSGKPVTESFVVVGAWKSGDSDVDSRRALVALPRLADMLGLADPATGDLLVHGIHVMLKDYRLADQARSDVLRALAGATVGPRLSEIDKVIAEVPARLSADKLDALVEETWKRMGGDGQPSAQVRKAVEDVLSTLSKPETVDGARSALRAGFSRSFEQSMSMGLLLEQSLILNAMAGVRDRWEKTVFSPPPAEPGGGAPSGPDWFAQRVVLTEALRELQSRVFGLVERPLDIEVRTWENAQRILLEAVDQEKKIVGFLVLLLNLFIACLVLLMLVLLVIEKTRDTGVLLALGGTTPGVVTVFFSTGLAIVVLGVSLGLGVGYIFVEYGLNWMHDAVFLLTGVKLFDPEIYRLDRLPAAVSVWEVLWSVLPSVIFGLLASMIPAIWASRHDPLRAIHYE